MTTSTVTVDPIELHRCSGCGKTLEYCDRKLLRHGTPCCGQCHVTDTHRNEDFDANCRRMQLLRVGAPWSEAYRRSREDPTAPRPTTRMVACDDTQACDLHGGDLLVIADSPARVTTLDRTAGTTLLEVVFPSGDTLKLVFDGTDRVPRLWRKTT